MSKIISVTELITGTEKYFSVTYDTETVKTFAAAAVPKTVIKFLEENRTAAAEEKKTTVTTAAGTETAAETIAAIITAAVSETATAETVEQQPETAAAASEQETTAEASEQTEAAGTVTEETETTETAAEETEAITAAEASETATAAEEQKKDPLLITEQEQQQLKQEIKAAMKNTIAAAAEITDKTAVIADSIFVSIDFIKSVNTETKAAAFSNINMIVTDAAGQEQEIKTKAEAAGTAAAFLNAICYSKKCIRKATEKTDNIIKYSYTYNNRCRTAEAEAVETIRNEITEAATKAAATAETVTALIKNKATKEQIETAAAAAGTAAEQKKQKLNRHRNNNTFDDIKTEFYKCYHAFSAIKAAAGTDAAATVTEYKTAENNFAAAVDSLCMILVLALLKKLSNVGSTTTKNSSSRTGTDKTKRDTNYFVIKHLKDDLIVSHNALINVNNDDNTATLNAAELSELFKKSCSIDSLDLINVAKEKLFELLSKNYVNTETNDFLDTEYKYIDVNKKTWTDITAVTYIKNVNVEEKKTADNTVYHVYTVQYCSDKIKVYTDNNVPKTVLKFVEHETAIKNNTYDKNKNLFLVEKTTCIASEISKAVRYYIQSEKTTTTNNSYCYIDDITSFTDAETGNKIEFNTYHRLKKYDSNLITGYNAEAATAAAVDYERITKIIKDMKISDNYKNVFNLLVRGYGYKTIAKILNLKVDTVKSTVRELRKKILKNELINNKHKFITFKADIISLNAEITKIKATAAGTALYNAVAIISDAKAKAKAAAAAIKDSSSRNRKKVYKVLYVYHADTAAGKNYYTDAKIYTTVSEKQSNTNNNYYIYKTVTTLKHINNYTLLQYWTDAETAATEAATEAEKAAAIKAADAAAKAEQEQTAAAIKAADAAAAKAEAATAAAIAANTKELYNRIETDKNYLNSALPLMISDTKNKIKYNNQLIRLFNLIKTAAEEQEQTEKEIAETKAKAEAAKATAIKAKQEKTVAEKRKDKKTIAAAEKKAKETAVAAEAIAAEAENKLIKLSADIIIKTAATAEAIATAAAETEKMHNSKIATAAEAIAAAKAAGTDAKATELKAKETLRKAKAEATAVNTAIKRIDSSRKAAAFLKDLKAENKLLKHDLYNYTSVLKKTATNKTADIIDIVTTDKNVYAIATAAANYKYKPIRAKAKTVYIDKTAVLNYRKISIATEYNDTKKAVPVPKNPININKRLKLKNTITFIDNMIFSDSMFNRYSNSNKLYNCLYSAEYINTVLKADTELTFDSITAAAEAENEKYNNAVNNFKNLTLYTCKMQ